MAVAFKNAAEQTFRTTTLGPLGFNGDAISLQQQIGLVPAGTVVITLTLTLIRNCENAAECAWAAADDLSLILNPLGTSAGMVLGTNLITNGGAEAGPVLCTQPPPRTFPDGPPRAEPSVATYGGMNWIATTDPGRSRSEPVLRTGRELSGSRRFSGRGLDRCGASDLRGVGVAGQSGRNDCADADLHFFNWAGTQLAPTAQLGPPSKTGTVLIETSHSDILPTGTRRVHIALTFPGDDSMADDIAFALAAPSGPPVITPGGIISASRPVLGLR